ncbi:hypothetical protein P7K49_030881 [Saguinus oedipus]|uniref:Uncharacterized protein n=1 Tax=Saguinus oedipus TaxID=9490 RepID=A0ABQ9U5H3_SAGOE|nr:hypothetical protein P7K49_030881 [Saguinus oedipus]
MTLGQFKLMTSPGAPSTQKYSEVPTSPCIISGVPSLQTHGRARRCHVPNVMLTHSFARFQPVTGRQWVLGQAGTHDITGISALEWLTVSAFASYALKVGREFGLQKAHFYSSLEPVKINTRLLAATVILLIVADTEESEEMLKGCLLVLSSNPDPL